MEICDSKNADLKPMEKCTLVTVCGYFVQENETGVITGFLNEAVHVLCNVHRFKAALHMNSMKSVEKCVCGYNPAASSLS